MSRTSPTSPASEVTKTKPAEPREPLLTGRDFVAYIQEKYLTAFKHSRLRKDRAKKVAPEPVARYCPSELFHPSLAARYVESLIQRTEALQNGVHCEGEEWARAKRPPRSSCSVT